MLKNKKAVYVLIPLNLLIWGYFGYRFYSMYTEGEGPLKEHPIQLVKQSVTKDSGSYKLKLDYKDPFLKDVKQESNFKVYHATETPVKKVEVARPVVPTVPKILPDIKYLGLIKNTTSGLTTALVSVNGQSSLIKQNESVEGIVFKSFNKDSLVAKWGKERIVVRK